MFDGGPFRDAHEAVWTRERYDALTEALAHIAVPWRHFAKQRMFAAVAADTHGDLPPADQVEAIHADLAGTFPQMVAEHAPDHGTG